MNWGIPFYHSHNGGTMEAYQFVERLAELLDKVKAMRTFKSAALYDQFKRDCAVLIGETNKPPETDKVE